MTTTRSSVGLLFTEEEQAAPAEVDVAWGRAALICRRAPGKQSSNEDACLVMELDDRVGLLAVADGCGGLPQGEVAARTALQTLGEVLCAEPAEAVPWSTRIYTAFEAASASVSALGGPCTTLSVILLEDGSARPFHAGDSPILIFGQRGRRKLEVVAHSPTAYAVEAGFLAEEDALVHEDRHLVLNALGAEGVRIDIGAPVPLRPFDTVVLASDGLSDNLYTDETVSLLRAGPLARGVLAAADLASKRMVEEGGELPGHADDLTLLAFRGPGPERGRRRKTAVG